jgi:predicted  nucleic acid-binding Zn-ribbon protein
MPYGKSPRETLEEKVRNSILQEAIFRWENAAVISLSLLLATFAPSVSYVGIIPWWAWLLGGIVATAGLTYSSMTDPEFGRRIAAQLLRSEFEPGRLKSRDLQQKMEQALDYRSRIEEAILEQRGTPIAMELARTANQIDEWLEHIYNLARRIDRYRNEQGVFARDWNSSQKRLVELRGKLNETKDPQIQRQIEATISALEKQVSTLESLDATIKRAELQLENTLTHLGTIYSQTMLVDAKDIDSGRARRLRQEIVDEVTEINDVLLAMDEVYAADIL